MLEKEMLETKEHTSVLFSRSIDEIDSELVWKVVFAMSDVTSGLAITLEN